jgi:hypothetical protein
MWPGLAAYFGANAGSDQRLEKPLPIEGVPELELSLAEWAKTKGQSGTKFATRHVYHRQKQRGHTKIGCSSVLGLRR